MRVDSVNNSGVMQSRPSDVQLRLDAVRNGLKQHGAAIVDTNNPVDMEVVARLKNQFGENNVSVEQSTNAKVTVKNFK